MVRLSKTLFVQEAVRHLTFSLRSMNTGMAMTVNYDIGFYLQISLNVLHFVVSDFRSIVVLFFAVTSE